MNILYKNNLYHFIVKIPINSSYCGKYGGILELHN